MFHKTVCVSVIALALSSAAIAQDDLAVDALRMSSASTESAAEIQRQIEQIDDQTTDMILEIQALQEQLESQRLFNEQQRIFLISQNNEIRSLEGLIQRLDELEAGFSALLPSLLDILDAYHAAELEHAQNADSFYVAELAEIRAMLQSDSTPDETVYAYLSNLLLLLHSRGSRMPLELPDSIETASGTLSVGRVADLEPVEQGDIAIRYTDSGLALTTPNRDVQIGQPDLENGFIAADSDAAGGLLLPLPGARDARAGLTHRESARDLVRDRQMSASPETDHRASDLSLPSRPVALPASSDTGPVSDQLQAVDVLDRLQAAMNAQHSEDIGRLEAFQAQLADVTALRDEIADAYAELEAEAAARTEQFDVNQARTDQLSGEFPPRRDRLTPILITIQQADQSMMRALRSTPVAHQYPHREALLPVAQDRQAYPALHQLEWRFRLIMSDMERHSEIVRYRARVRFNDDVRDVQLVRIGALTAFTRIDGHFYRLAPNDDYSTRIPDLVPVEAPYQAMYARYWETEPSDTAPLYIPRPRSRVYLVMAPPER